MRAALVDVSRWQGEVNVRAIADAGFVGIVARCTIGLIYLDPQYKATQQKARDAGLIFGAYHVLWPENRDGALEAEWFDENAGDVDLAVLDVELTHGLSLAQVQSQAQDWLLELERWRRTRQVVYTGSWFWTAAAARTGLSSWESEYPLWEAEYTLSHPRGGIDPAQAPTGEPKSPAPGFEGWAFWQWTSGGKPIGVKSESLDYNVFNGSVQELRQFLGLEPPIAVPVDLWALELDAWARSRGYMGPMPLPEEV